MTNGSNYDQPTLNMSLAELLWENHDCKAEDGCQECIDLFYSKEQPSLYRTNECPDNCGGCHWMEEAFDDGAIDINGFRTN